MRNAEEILLINSTFHIPHSAFRIPHSSPSGYRRNDGDLGILADARLQSI
jgi:hypothetical protein